MKKLFLFLTLSSLVFSGAVSAVEYVTLNFAKQSINTDPTDLIQCVGIQDSWKRNTIQGTMNGVEEELFGNENPSFYIGSTHTGVSNIRISYYGSINDPDNPKGWVTYKITKASEINKVGPTSVLILPENATGNYDLIVESSSDSVTWTPFHSQVVQSDTVKRLFRVRIVHKGQEEAKAKAKKD